MTLVDLNRLREALLGNGDGDKVHADLKRAVLDAPTEWRCAVSGADTVQPACGHDPDETGCGWRARVPVKGENDAM